MGCWWAALRLCLLLLRVGSSSLSPIAMQRSWSSLEDEDDASEIVPSPHGLGAWSRLPSSEDEAPHCPPPEQSTQPSVPTRGRKRQLCTRHPRKPTRSDARTEALTSLAHQASSATTSTGSNALLPAGLPQWFDQLRPIPGDRLLTSMQEVLRKPVPRTAHAAEPFWVNCFNRDQPRKAMPLKSEAVLCKTQPSNLLTFLHETAAAVYFTTRLFWASIVSHIAAQILREELEPIVFICYVAYDETPLPFRHSQPAKPGSAASALASVAGVPASALAIGAARTRAARKGIPHEATEQDSKVQQCEVAMAIVTRRVGHKKASMVWTEFPCHLQHGSSNSGAVIRAEIQRQISMPFLGLVLRSFHQVWMSNRDCGSGNIKHEQSYGLPTEFWVWMGIFCCIHYSHSVYGGALWILQPTVSGVISLAIFSNQTGALDKLRGCTRRALLMKVIVSIGGSPPNSQSLAMRHRKALLDIWENSKPGTARSIRRQVIEQGLQSPWDLEEICLYLPEGTDDHEREGILAEWADDMSMALWPGKLRVFLRNRWCLANPTAAEVMLLSSAHNLLKSILELFCGTGGRNRWTAPDEAIVAQEERIVVQGEADRQHYWAAFNAKARSNAEKLGRDPDTPFWSLLWMLALQPNIEFNRLLTHISSSLWDSENDAEAVKTGARKYRIVEAASGRITQQFLLDCESLAFDSDSWMGIPHARQTERAASMAWCMLSHSCAGIVFTIAMCWEAYPFRLFLLLDPALNMFVIITALLADPSCMYDDFAIAFFTRFNTRAALSGVACLATLTAIAVLIRLDVARQECRHGAVRRLLSARGPTWVAEFCDISSNFLLQREQILENDASLLKTRADCEKEDEEQREEEKEEEVKTPVAHGGGQHRAFFHKWFSEHPLGEYDSRQEWFLAAHRAYKELLEGPAEDLEPFARLGSLARDASYVTPAPFGTPPSKQRRGSQSALVAPAFGSEEHTPTALVPVSTGDRVSTQGLADQGVFTAIRATARLANQRARERRAQNTALVDAHVRRTFLDTSTAACHTYGALPGWCPEAGARPQQLPSASALEVVHWTMPGSSMAKALLRRMPLTIRNLMVDHYRRMHQEFKDTAENALPKRASGRTLCFFARMCVCGKVVLKLFVNALLQTLRHVCPPHSSSRFLLKKGVMVLEIRFFDSEVSHWLYPGYINLTTFRGAVLPLLADDDPTRSARACYLGLVALTALQEPGFSIGTWWQVASRFGEAAFDAPAVVRFYQFSCDLRRLDEFVPGHLLLSRLHGLGEISFWHGPPPDTRSNAARHRKGNAVPLDGAAAPLPLQDEPVDPPDLEDDIPDENEPDPNAAELGCGLQEVLRAAEVLGKPAARDPPIHHPGEGGGPSDASSSAESDGEAPAAPAPPPPPPAPPVVLEQARRRPVFMPARDRRADPFPRLYAPEDAGYLKMSKGPTQEFYDFRAVCFYHDKCTFTRTCKPFPRTPRSPQQLAVGRPGGALWLWLTNAWRYDTKEDHKGEIAMTYIADHTLRVAAREEMESDPLWVAQEFDTAERAPRDGEGREPVGLIL